MSHHQLNGAIKDAGAALRPVGQNRQPVLVVFDRNLGRHWVVVARHRLLDVDLPRVTFVSLTSQHLPAVRVRVEDALRLHDGEEARDDFFSKLVVDRDRADHPLELDKVLSLVNAHDLAHPLVEHLMNLVNQLAPENLNLRFLCD